MLRKTVSDIVFILSILILTRGCIIEGYQRVYSRYDIIGNYSLSTDRVYYQLADTLGIRLSCSVGYVFEEDSLITGVSFRVENNSSQEIRLDLKALFLESNNYSYSLTKRKNHQATPVIFPDQEYHTWFEYQVTLSDQNSRKLPNNEEVILQFPSVHKGDEMIELAPIVFIPRNDK